MRRTGGFSLVEILIVVAIIALVAAIGIPNLLRARVSSNEASAKAGLKTIASALEMYSIANGSYPPDTTALLSQTPPYLNKDYFNGVQNGYIYAGDVQPYSYSVTATPNNANSGRVTYTITTGSVMNTSP